MKLEYKQLAEELSNENETIALEDADGDVAEMDVETLHVVELPVIGQDGNTHLAFADESPSSAVWTEPPGAAANIIEVIGRPARYGWFFDSSQVQSDVRSVLPQQVEETLPDLSEVAIDGYVPVVSRRPDHCVLFEAESMMIVDSYGTSEGQATAFADRYIMFHDASEEMQDMLEYEGITGTRVPWDDPPSSQVTGYMPRTYGWNFRYAHTPQDLGQYSISTDMNFWSDVERSNKWIDLMGDRRHIMDRNSLVIHRSDEYQIIASSGDVQNEHRYGDSSNTELPYSTTIRIDNLDIDPRDFEPDFLDDVRYDGLSTGTAIYFRMHPGEEERCGVITKILMDDRDTVKAYRVLEASSDEGDSNICVRDVLPQNIHWWGDDAFDEITETIGGSVGR